MLESKLNLFTMHTITQKGGTSQMVKNRENTNSKQLRAISLLQKKVENREKINLWSILIESGYSPNTAKTPQKVFWKAAMKRELESRGLDPEWLKKTHEDFLNAKIIKKYEYPLCIPQEDIIFAFETYMRSICLCTNDNPRKGVREYHIIEPHWKVMAKWLELWYKIFPPKPQIDQATIDRFSQKRIDKIRELTKGIKLRKPENV